MPFDTQNMASRSVSNHFDGSFRVSRLICYQKPPGYPCFRWEVCNGCCAFQILRCCNCGKNEVLSGGWKLPALGLIIVIVIIVKT